MIASITKMFYLLILSQVQVTIDGEEYFKENCAELNCKIQYIHYDTETVTLVLKTGVIFKDGFD